MPASTVTGLKGHFEFEDLISMAFQEILEDEFPRCANHLPG